MLTLPGGVILSYNIWDPSALERVTYSNHPYCSDPLIKPLGYLYLVLDQGLPSIVGLELALRLLWQIFHCLNLLNIIKDYGE